MGKGASMKPGRVDAKHLSLILVKRIALLFLATCLFSLFYLVVGSLSSFLDETQLLLLTALRWSAFGLLATATAGVLLTLALALWGMHEARAAGFLGYVLASFFSAGCLALVDALTILSRGLR